MTHFSLIQRAAGSLEQHWHPVCGSDPNARAHQGDSYFPNQIQQWTINDTVLICDHEPISPFTALGYKVRGLFSTGAPRTLSSHVLCLGFPSLSWALSTAQPAQDTTPAPIHPLLPTELFYCQYKRWEDAFFLLFVKFQAEKRS